MKLLVQDQTFLYFELPPLGVATLLHLHFREGYEVNTLCVILFFFFKILIGLKGILVHVRMRVKGSYSCSSGF